MSPSTTLTSLRGMPSTIALTQYAGTVLLVAHDRDFVQRFPDRIWKMAGEKVIRDSRK